MEIKVAALEALVVDMGAQMTAMQGAHGAQMAAMQARMAALEASMAAPLAGSASCHAVLSSPDLWLVLWPSLDRVSKVALRGVSKGMRSQVDASIKVVASPASGFSPSALSAALVHWHAVHDLKLLAVSGAADLAPLATASLAGLTSLTVRQADPSQVLDVPTFSSSVAAALRVIDVSGCAGIRSVNFICNCEQLRCLWMPGVRVSDLWPLVACSETLEELWLAGSVSVKSLEPLEACNKLRKLDLRHCYHTLYGQVEDLQLCCTQLADPVSVEIEGLVHELQRDIPPSMQAGAAYALGEFCVDGEDTEMQNAIAAAGAIPSLVQLLGRDVSTEVQAAAARAVGVLAGGHAQNQVAIAAAGAIPPLLELLGPASSAGVLAEASDALRSLASNYALNQAAIVASGVIPALVRLLEHADDEHDAHRYVQAAAACAMRALAEGNAQGEAAISAAGGIPALVVLLRPAAWPAAQEAASHILRRLAVNHGQCQVAMVAAGAIPALAKLLERGGGGEEEDEDDDDGLAAVRVAAAYTLCDLAEGNVQRQDAIASAGAILTLAMMLGPESSADAQKAAARALRILAAENAKNQLFIARAGAIPGLVLLLRPESTADLQVAAADALGSLAVDHARNQVDIVAAEHFAGALSALVDLLGDLPIEIWELRSR
ncbi:hypothetical protein FOA52_015874 [Chlamydomonas sp. UWO 241]|nr:hypothetical protein FOA52_015874 [Chlamydomonas sp. UWO 241]